MIRRSIKVRGIVQGVGFRPFVAKAAHELGLTGWVRNDRDGATMEIQGSRAELEAFERALSHIPAPASISELIRRDLPPTADATFTIQPSDGRAPAGAALPPDLATCGQCVEEIFSSSERRYAYPFTNCTACGPRYTLVERLPYDRLNTSMAGFELCAECRREYEDPLDRRYHAEPIACAACGPRLEFLDARGSSLAFGGEALARACRELELGRVVAVLGIGGFQLLVDASNDEAVRRLRQRKHRPHKPLAVMFPSLEHVRSQCVVTAGDVQLLTSSRAPIVLLERKLEAPTRSPIAASVAPESRWLGAFLPTSPLHHLLLAGLERPVVCTSGNRVDEPICISTSDALHRLSAVVDAFVTHDRPVLRPVDDSLARSTSRGPEILRRARGYSGETVARLPTEQPMVALGGHLKSTVTFAVRGACVMSQHLGDLEDARSEALLRSTVDDLLRFFDVSPNLIACDKHPDYASSALAEELSRSLGAALVRVQHHHAHVAAVMAEHGLAGEVTGIAWDGTGYGDDGHIWGGEVLVANAGGYRRLAHVAEFPLPGGDLASRQPWRSAVGLLTAAGANTSRVYAPEAALGVVSQALERGLNVWRTSSMGRLFDAVANLLLGGLGQPFAERALTCSFEGQAAMLLEALACQASDPGGYGLPLVEINGHFEADTQVLLEALLADIEHGTPAPVISRRFHEGVVQFGVDAAKLAGLERVVLSGGCFQNLLLRQRLCERLEQEGFDVYCSGAVPTNDGGLSLGQLWVAAHGTA